MTVAVITDSANDLPSTLIAALGITVVPLEVRLGDHPPDELRGISGERFWELQHASAAIAETAAPSPGEFADAFRAAKDAGASGVVCITLSSGLSATYQAALTGAATVPDIEIVVFDSRTVTMGQGLLVLEAATSAAAGAALADVVGELERQRELVSVYGTLDTLEYLRRGGRIGSAQAFIGSLLSIKPVIEVRGGAVEGESRQRTRARSLRYLADKVGAAGPLHSLAVVHAAADDVSVFLEMLATLPGAPEIITTPIGPVVGAHTGPGTIGVCLLRSAR